MIIDIRCRPPIKEFQAAFKNKAFLGVDSYSRFTAGLGAEPPSFTNDSIELMFSEMNQAGVTKGVVVGRIRPNFNVTNDSIAETVKRHSEKLIGIAGIDVWNEFHQAIPEIERSIRKLNLTGVSIEPGGVQRAMHFNDPRLYPIYAKCDELKVPVFLTTGPRQGPSLDYTSPVNVEPVARYFPKLKIVCAHGCYPYVMEMLGVAIRCPNVFFAPDFYAFWPGGEAYLSAADEKLQDQFLFGTAYPISAFKESVEATKRFVTRKESQDKIFYQNAERFLGS